MSEIFLYLYHSVLTQNSLIYQSELTQFSLISPVNISINVPALQLQDSEEFIGNYSVHNPKGVGAISNRPQCVIRLMVDGEYHSCEYQLSDSLGRLIIAPTSSLVALNSFVY